MKKALIIFIRKPELGRVKTRLAAQVGDAKALQVYLKLLQHTRDVAKEIDCDRYVFVNGQMPDNAWEDFSYEHQPDGDLGKKMLHAFNKLFQKDYTHIVIIGSDCPGLAASHISEAFNILEEKDVVIGPAQDGGYYLLGMKKMHHEIFTNKSWSSANVLDETTGTLKALNLTYQLIDFLTDVDELKDLPETYREEIFPGTN